MNRLQFAQDRWETFDEVEPDELELVIKDAIGDLQMAGEWLRRDGSEGRDDVRRKLKEVAELLKEYA